MYNRFKDWCEEVKKRCHTKLTDEQEKALIIATIDEDKINKIPGIEEELDNGGGFASVIWKRMKALGCKITPSSLFFLESITFNFGISTMLCAFLWYTAKKEGIEEITAIFIQDKVFPEGIPSNDDWNELWKKQKIKGGIPDNILDYTETYGSD